MHDHRRQAEFGDRLGDASETWGGDGKTAERIALKSIKAKRHDQRFGREGLDTLAGGFERFEKDRIAGFALERQVIVVAEPRTLTALIRIAPEERIETHRIGVD